MKKLIYSILLFPTLLLAEIKSQPPTLQQLKDVDLMTAKPLVITSKGVYSCPDVSWTMYLEVSDKNGKGLAPVGQKARV